jgi:hypothetical protein
MNKKEIRAHIEEGYVRVAVIFELVGKPKSHIEQTLKAYVEKVASQEDITLLKEEYEDTNELEEGVFSVIAELELLVKDMEKLTWLCLNFTPASVEVLEPDSKTLQQQELTHWLNDLLARLHEIGMVQKNLQGQHHVLVKNFNAMTRNALLLALQHTKEVSVLAKQIGMDVEHTKKFLEALIKEGKVREEKGNYHLQ